MAANPTQLRLVGTDANKDRTLGTTLDGLKSKELVFAFSGPLGSGLKDVVSVLKSTLRDLDYQVVHIKLSALIAENAHLDPSENKESILSLVGVERYNKLQALGNSLRSASGLDILAQLAVREISVDRASRTSEDVKNIIPGRVAYLVDQLKNPSEVKLLRAVYRDNFYLVGVLCGYTHRKKNLKDEGLTVADAESVMERDRNERVVNEFGEAEESGQQMEKTLLHADFFIRNERSNVKQLSEPIQRFMHLVHGSLSITPTQNEQGMYAAFAAATGSACLSRQVGAAVMDRQGKLISTGCNDVPRGGGGLYREGDQNLDFRCIHLHGGVCFNDREKDTLGSQIKNIICASLKQHLSGKLHDKTDIKNLSDSVSEAIAKKIRSDSRLKDLIEFSRSVHAEMNALISLSRTGQGGAQDGVLYTTTYPCHNCARHIVAAGIRAVYFIEPYEKSLAASLHEDAIEHDADEELELSDWIDVDRRKQRKVRFLHFEGVAPSRFLDLFTTSDPRKMRGKAPNWEGRSAKKRVPEYLEGYMDVESRVVKHLEGLGLPSDDRSNSE